MGWTAGDLPDLSARRAVVTGANSGIGLQTALELARHGASVTLACRDLAKAGRARDRIRAEVGRGGDRSGDGSGDVSVGVVDLSDLESVRTFAASWDGPLDLLVNNAGVMAPLRRAETPDGFERQMGTNHLGHFALTGRLLPWLLAAPGARVVAVSSIAHRSGRIDLDDLQSIVGYRPRQAYSNSKLANLLFAFELQRRADAHGADLTSTAAHPGVSVSGLTSNPDGMGGNPLVRAVAPLAVRVTSQSAAAGARPVLYAATVAAPGSYTGSRWLRETRGAPAAATPSTAAADPVLAAGLWDLSAELTGVDFAWPG